MARPDLTITLTKGADCKSLTISDTTVYGGETVTANSVTSVSIVLRYESEGFYITYLFTVVSGTITAATLSLNGAPATNILANLVSTVFPITNFNVTGNYGVTIPDVTDGVYQVEYTIGGSGYSYTTSEATIISCDTCCCVTKKWIDIDPNLCSDTCFEKKMLLAMKAETYLNIAHYNVDAGDATVSADALRKAQAYCDCDCNCK